MEPPEAIEENEAPERAQRLPDPCVVMRADGTFTARSYARGIEAHGRTREEALARLEERIR